MIFSRKYQSGFTLVEVIVALAVFASLFAIVVINLLNVSLKATLSESIDTFNNNFKSQQLKAMVGDTEGNSIKENIGIYLATDKYIDFYGSYKAQSSANLEIKFDDNIRLVNTSFPSSQIIFIGGNGEILGATGNNTITLQNTLSGEQKIITINKYGVVTSVN
ncbi:type II secretion system GspH family protein [Candidatus Microgenomates bacterium]|nr:type II secretion system GspH family protein [Candidatus Microgenomates bacterium]